MRISELRENCYKRIVRRLREDNVSKKERDKVKMICRQVIYEEFDRYVMEQIDKDSFKPKQRDYYGE